MIDKLQRIFELEICAVYQGYGEDLRPLYKNPMLSLGTYLLLIDILWGEEEHG